MNSDAFFDRYAISTFLYRKHPLDEALRRIASAGFRWVEIWADTAHLDPRLGSVDLDAVRRLLDELGLQVHSVHTPFNGLFLSHPILNDGAHSRQMIGQAIRQAAALGAKAAVVHPSSDPAEMAPDQHSASRQVSQGLVADMVEVAEGVGTRVALENTVRRPFWRFGIHMAQLVNDFPDPRIGFCLDIGHSLLNGVDPIVEAREAGDRLISIHVANNDGERDRHYPPTQGVLDWPALAQALDDAGYGGGFVLETDAHGDADAMLARLSKLWQELP